MWKFIKFFFFVFLLIFLVPMVWLAIKEIVFFFGDFFGMAISVIAEVGYVVFCNLIWILIFGLIIGIVIWILGNI